jgi:hypothetical protein
LFQSTLPRRERQYPLEILIYQGLAKRFPRIDHLKNLKKQPNNPSYSAKKSPKTGPSLFWELGVRAKLPIRPDRPPLQTGFKFDAQ